MRFERVGGEHYERLTLPLGYVVNFGEDERLGVLDESGRFSEVKKVADLPASDLARLTHGMVLVLPCRAEVRDDDGELLVELEFGVEGVQAVCRSIVAAPGQQLTGSLLRALPIAALARQTVQANVARLLRWNGDLFAARFPGVERPNVESRKRHIVSDDFLTEVASAYREALAAGLPTAQEIQRRFGPTHPANARRWILRARKRGLLGPAPGRGRRGEALHET